MEILRDVTIEIRLDDDGDASLETSLEMWVETSWETSWEIIGVICVELTVKFL